MSLYLSANEPQSVFSLLGSDENSATFALGWVFERCPKFRNEFLTNLIGQTPSNRNDVDVYLQRREKESGITDIEIHCANFCHVIIEAKRGWTLPHTEQLERYAKRIRKDGDIACRLVSVSAATARYAAGRLRREIEGILVVHRSWGDIRFLAEIAYAQARGLEEKLWIRELVRHLGGFVSMQNPRDNLVYVVALSREPVKEGDTYTWIDVFEKDNMYFHPVGNRYPTLPPNYIGFRYDGRLQAVRHIDRYKVVRNLSEVNPKWPETVVDHFVYTLGPAMQPMKPIRTGKIYRNHRVWCAIDTLLSGAHETISDARDETQRRLGDYKADADATDDLNEDDHTS
jgi:hypothetical protein